MNSVEDRKNDKGENVKKQDVGHKELHNLVNINQLEDVWRQRYPNDKKYTYHKKNTKSASRIDFWLTSKSLQLNVVKVGQKISPQCDHSGITLQLNTSKCDRGKGFWKMNVELLNSKLFDESFKIFWKKWESKITDYDDIKLWWEITKIKIKELSLEVSKQIAKQENEKIQSIEKQIVLEKNNISPNNAHIEALQNELDNYYTKNAKGARIRARILNYHQNFSLVKKSQKEKANFGDK